jgi:hypothetical protein
MTITQTVDIPADRRIFFEVPPQIPTGKITLTFTPVSASKEPIKNSAERDLEIINKNAERLNSEALDVLSYQDMYLD